MQPAEFRTASLCCTSRTYTPTAGLSPRIPSTNPAATCLMAVGAGCCFTSISTSQSFAAGENLLQHLTLAVNGSILKIGATPRPKSLGALHWLWMKGSHPPWRAVLKRPNRRGLVVNGEFSTPETLPRWHGTHTKMSADLFHRLQTRLQTSDAATILHT